MVVSIELAFEPTLGLKAAVENVCQQAVDAVRAGKDLADSLRPSCD